MNSNNLHKIARHLRRNMTHAEWTLWLRLRNKQLGVKFRRQEPIGRYIVDFVCYEKRLVIEVDGGQHAESRDDLLRDQWLKENGFTVLRFWNHEVLKNIEGVMQVIIEELNSTSSQSSSTEGRGGEDSPSPSPSQNGRGEKGGNAPPSKERRKHKTNRGGVMDTYPSKGQGDSPSPSPSQNGRSVKKRHHFSPSPSMGEDKGGGANQR